MSSSPNLYVCIYRSFLRVAKFNGWKSPYGVIIRDCKTKKERKRFVGYEWYNFEETYQTYSYVPRGVKKPHFHTMLANIKIHIKETPPEKATPEAVDMLFSMLRYANSSYDQPLCYKRINKN
tara:strand:+ start:292 stop:657 length:366 start_codon:yes stop_codon:yes gene_type:complete